MSSLKERYLEELTSGASLTMLCNLTAEQIGMPVAICLRTRTIIAHSIDYGQELLNEYVKGPEFCNEEELKAPNEELFRSLASGKASTRSFPYVHHKRINCGCFYQNNIIAFLDVPVLLAEWDQKEVYDTLELAASIFVIALRMNAFVSPHINHSLSTYLVSLLSEEYLQIHQQVNVYQSALKSVNKWRLIFIKPNDPQNLSRIHGALDALCSRHSSMWMADYEEGIVLMIESTQVSILIEWSEDLAGLCLIAVGDSFSQLTQTKKQYQIARATIQLGKALEEKGPLIYVYKYKYPLILLDNTQNIDSGSLPDLPEIIRNYDRGHSGEYYTTVRAYLLNHMNYDETAEYLHVHKNTVIYRIRRVCEIFHLDLNDCGVISMLYLSLFEKKLL